MVFGRTPAGVFTGVGDEIGGDEQNEEKSKSEMPMRDMTTSADDFSSALREIQNKSSILSPLSHTHEGVCDDACVHEKIVHMHCVW